jgi:uncharacterized protein (TIGR03086 family)
MGSVTAPAELLELLVTANDEFSRRLRLVGAADWQRATPCSEWDVRALVNHVVGANLRYQLLLDGASTEQVEATRSLDHLGDDAVSAFVATADALVTRFEQGGALERVTHHVTGARSGRDLLAMRILDTAVHAWDLARAIGADETLDDRVVSYLLAYAAGLDLGAAQRSFAPASSDLPPDASAQDELLHRLGREPHAMKEVP